jgi:hypothetical protein
LANVHLLSSAEPTAESPYVRRDFERLMQAVAADSIKAHTLTADPREADLILFVGSGKPGQTDVLSHPYMKAFRRKCFLVDASDRTLPVVPGLYASAERSWFPRYRFKAGFYFRTWENQAIQYTAPSDALPLLFSFAGAGANSRVRESLLRLRHPRAELLDTSALPVAERQRDGSSHDDYGARYARLLARSKFVLCPRGIGSCSWRLFETMKAGRVPVILSDAWVPPEGPEWSSFSLWVSEAQAQGIPRLLEEHEHLAPAMGQQARREWENFFSREVAFHRVVEWCLAIKAQQPDGFDLGALCVWPHLLRPFFFRHWLLNRAKTLVRGYFPSH